MVSGIVGKMAARQAAFIVIRVMVGRIVGALAMIVIGIVAGGIVMARAATTVIPCPSARTAVIAAMPAPAALPMVGMRKADQRKGRERRTAGRQAERRQCDAAGTGE
jgi:hypothetical protein